MATIDLGRVRGRDGVSPTVNVSDIEGGHRVSITDVTETKSFNVLHGVSPTIEINDIEGGHRVSITDVTGTRSFDIDDGSKSILPIKRKILAMSGGLYNLNKTLKSTNKLLNRDLYCTVSEVVEPTDTSTTESVLIKCGSFGVRLRLRLDSNKSNMYRITSINSWGFDLGSMYVAMGSSRVVTLKEINIDNTVYEDFSALKTVDFMFKRLLLMYDATSIYDGEEYTCTTTICITPDGFSIMETVNTDIAKPQIPTGFISHSGSNVKEKARHGNKLVFSLTSDVEGPYPTTYIETIENYELTSIRHFSFGGVE